MINIRLYTRRSLYAAVANEVLLLRSAPTRGGMDSRPTAW